MTSGKSKISVEESIEKLKGSGREFIELFEHGSLQIEIYKPDRIDKQKPHDRDELYVIISGTGEFLVQGERVAFSAHDIFFVPAGADHRFENFSDDFSTWVFFYGPKGGE